MTAAFSDPVPAQRLAPARTGVDALLAAATQEVLVLSGESGPPCPVDHATLARGVRYRFLLPDGARTAPRLGDPAGVDTRTVPVVPADAIIIDSAVVIVPATGGTGMAVVRLPSVVAGLADLFERVWADGVPLSQPEGPGGTGLGARERLLLRMLNDGSTDERVAIRLGLSVRTVRRMVSELMRRLGARSRFQAGAKAAERGWLPER